MVKKKPEVDIVREILEDCILAYPVSSFIISLYKQYGERGSLSKKQLQGLHAKASNIKDLQPGKLATLQAIINKMVTRDKSPLPVSKPIFTRDESTGQLIEALLEKFPQHKRVLFLRSKFDNNETLSPTELADLKRFSQLLK